MENNRNNFKIRAKYARNTYDSQNKDKIDTADEDQILDKSKTLEEFSAIEPDDPALDKIVDDIVRSESSEVIAAEDSMKSDQPQDDKPKTTKFKQLIKNKWLYISLGAVVIAIFAVPISRYKILGLFVKNTAEISVIDNITRSPVSGALVTIGNEKATTNANGQVNIKLPLGNQRYTVAKRYYDKSSGNLFVGLSKPIGTLVVLKAVGRVVTINVSNKISGAPISGVNIAVQSTVSITNTKGLVNIVLPTKSISYQATLSATGYNPISTSILVTTRTNANNIKLVPSGHIFYLSNATGSVNVIKANLDGSNPTIELAGDSDTTASTSVLMASPDWQYLVLEAKRNTTTAELYLINTTNGNVTEFDSSPDNFNLIGWSGDQFIYDAIDPSKNTQTAGREEIKSYNATNAELNVLDINQVNGNSSSYAYQSFANFNLLPGLLVYSTSWTSVGSYDLSSLNDSVRAVETGGQNKRDYQTFQASTIIKIASTRYLPESIYFSITNSSNQTSYYGFSNNAINPANINALTFSASYPSYYLSPSNEQSIWTDPKSKLNYIANQSGQNTKQVNLPPGYSIFGWYDNVYILLANNNQLYITPSSGSKSPQLIGSYINSSG